ncbi:hypothetical protein MUK42_36275 [Musa troglodytarum]|uniref:KNOX1 domain-containing protein n=1 Tax=Musa troglodytarum TaxID=320322 RepID=A0A9E7EZW7_9LILI|nr:hypothetical protein MUK42_36275 [Musa troglodytarum]
MEEFSHLEGGSTSRGANFLYLPSSTTTTTSAAAQLNAAAYGRSCHPTLPYLQPPVPLKPEVGSSLQPSSSQERAVEGRGQGEISPGDTEEMKAKIMSHPQYSTLIGAYISAKRWGAAGRGGTALGHGPRAPVALPLPSGGLLRPRAGPVHGDAPKLSSLHISLAVPKLTRWSTTGSILWFAGEVPRGANEAIARGHGLPQEGRVTVQRAHQHSIVADLLFR